MSDPPEIGIRICVLCGPVLAEHGPSDALMSARTPEEQARYGY